MQTSISTDSSLIKGILSGSIPAVSRAISIVEEGGEAGKALLAQVFSKTNGIRILGITGSPGAGKSTLTDKIALELASQGKKVAILAVDPSSPFTGGALLGDRIRMVGSSEKNGIFIRSMASRGALGGLAPRTKEVIYILDAAGFDVVLIETVGVGQGEIEIVRTSDTVLVVLVPGMGDGVQALKAGILEIADVYAINKADYEGVERLEKELYSVLGLVENRIWNPKVQRTVATTGSGIPELMGALQEHWISISSSEELVNRRERFLSQYLQDSTLETISRRVVESPQFKELLSAQVKLLKEKQTDPVSAIAVLSNVITGPSK